MNFGCFKTLDVRIGVFLLASAYDQNKKEIIVMQHISGLNEPELMEH